MRLKIDRMEPRHYYFVLWFTADSPLLRLHVFICSTMEQWPVLFADFLSIARASHRNPITTTMVWSDRKWPYCTLWASNQNEVDVSLWRLLTLYGKKWLRAWSQYTYTIAWISMNIWIWLGGRGTSRWWYLISSKNRNFYSPISWRFSICNCHQI